LAEKTLDGPTNICISKLRGNRNLIAHRFLFLRTA